MDDPRISSTLGTWSAWAGAPATWPVTRLGAAAVEWAVDVHRTHFGDEFLLRALDDLPPHPFVAGLRWPLTGATAIVGLLARACALARLPIQTQEELAFRHRVASNRLINSDLVVLEVAGLAMRDGWGVEVEPSLPSGRRPDLRLSQEDNELLVEVTHVGPDAVRQDTELWTDAVFQTLRATESKRGVAIRCQADSRKLAGTALESFLARVDAEAERVASTGLPMHLVEVGLAVEIRPARTDSMTFTGPPLSGDLWTRLGRRLEDKARQTEGVAAAWIYVDDASDMFALTDLALVAEPEQLRRLAHNITVTLSEYAHLVGVVLSTGVSINSAAVDAETRLEIADPRAGLDADSVVLHRRLPSGRARRTFVIRLPRTVEPWTLAPLVWLQHEGSWLDWALANVGQPSVREILGLGGTS